MLRRHCTPFTLPLLLFLSVWFFHAVAFAQWSADGVPISAESESVRRWQVVPDHDGGFYSVYGSSVAGCRVQKFDSNGVALWGTYGLRMFPDSLDYGASFTGADTTGDGGVIVCFTNYEIHPETGVDVYAQRFSPDGERMFGPMGAVLSEAPGHQVNDEFAFKQTVGDRHGGIWAVMLSGVADSTIVNGVNGDGTQKRAHDYLVAHGDLHIGEQCGFGTDINGGLVVAWSDPTTHYPTSRLERIWLGLDGQEVVPPMVIGERTYADFWRIAIFGLPNGGIYYMPSSDFQIEHPDHSLSWDLNLTYHVIHVTESCPSNAVLTADGNILRFFTGTSGGYLYWLHPNGTPVLDSALTYVDSTHGLSYNWATLLIPTADQASIYSVTPYYWRGNPMKILIRKWNSSGNNEWNGWDGELFQRPPNNSYGLDHLEGCRLSDGCVVVAIRASGAHLNRLMKFYPDGSIAGVANSVPDQPPTLSPATFHFLSAYPNPFNGTVQFVLNVQKPGTYTLALFNIQGQRVQQINKVFSHGTSTITFSPAKELASGVYFAVWEGENSERQIKKVVLLR